MEHFRVAASARKGEPTPHGLRESRGSRRAARRLELAIVIPLGLVAGCVAAAYFGPLFYDQWARERALKRSAVRGEQLAVAWRQRVASTGASGPLGTYPPMLEVTDRGDSVTLKNIGDKVVQCAELKRVPAVTVEAGSSSCVMVVRGTFYSSSSAGTPYMTCVPMRPGELLGYELKPGSGAYCATLPLEFRVGGPDSPDVTWWSESALVEFDARRRSRR